VTVRFVKTGAVRFRYIAFAMGPSIIHEDLLLSKSLTKIKFPPKINTATSLETPSVFFLQPASQLRVLALIQMKSDHNDQSNFFKFHLNVFHLHLVPNFLFLYLSSKHLCTPCTVPLALPIWTESD
jgi:hypothetical protein